MIDVLRKSGAANISRQTCILWIQDSGRESITMFISWENQSCKYFQAQVQACSNVFKLQDQVMIMIPNHFLIKQGFQSTDQNIPHTCLITTSRYSCLEIVKSAMCRLKQCTKSFVWGQGNWLYPASVFRHWSKNIPIQDLGRENYHFMF